MCAEVFGDLVFHIVLFFIGRQQKKTAPFGVLAAQLIQVVRQSQNKRIWKR
jgi:hypothetical protein